MAIAESAMAKRKASPANTTQSRSLWRRVAYAAIGKATHTESHLMQVIPR